MKILLIGKFKSAVVSIGVIVLFLGSIAIAQKSQQISATAMGTSTQLGRIINVDVRISELSTPEDQKVLLAVFAESGNEGLTNALEKMKSKGRLAITGTLGYDVNYIREIKMPDGSRKIRFVTDRMIRFGEVWGSTRSMDYSLAMGEIIIAKDKKSSSGTLMPAAKLRINKEGEVEIETFQNPWRLTNIKVWK